MASSAAGGASQEEQTVDQLENSIVQDFQNLQVLTAYRYDQMGEFLVRDLSNALEESVKQKTCHKKDDTAANKHRVTSRKGKRKSKRRKSAFTSGKLSDSKESSVDEAVRDLVENVTQQSDSDDWIRNGHGPHSLSNISKQTVPQVESDSFTENFSPMQPSRHRRRKFKRMAVDLSPEENTGASLTKSSSDSKLKSKVHLTSSDNIMDEDCRSRSPVIPGTSARDTLPGKRKRGTRCPGNSFEVELGNEECVAQNIDSDGKMEQDQKESSTSSLSSSECSEVRFTGDEGQEGDDEQSDFFFEPGPACGIPGIIPWWEKEATGGENDKRFDDLLNGSLQHMSQAAQRSFKDRLKQLTKPGREYKSARRYFKDRRPAYSLSRFLQDRQKWGDACGKKIPGAVGGNTWHCNGSNGSVGEYTKRRRKTPPSTPEGEFVGQNADPIPESNIGSRLLQNMGWSPGNGLGADGLGIQNPIMAYRKNNRKGLGATASTPS